MPSPGQEGVPFLDDITQYPAGTQYAPTIATDPWTVQASIIQRLQYSQSQGNQGLAKVGIDSRRGAGAGRFCRIGLFRAGGYWADRPSAHDGFQCRDYLARDGLCDC